LGLAAIGDICMVNGNLPRAGGVNTSTASHFLTKPSSLTTAVAPTWTSSRVRLQHLFGMFAGGVSQLGAAQHASDFLGAFFPGNRTNRCPGAAADVFLFDQIVVVGEGCDLWKVSDAKHLVGAGQAL